VYSVLYSHNDGGNWQALAVDLAGTQFSLDPSLIRGGPGVWFRVTANDGFNQGMATVGPINVVQQPRIAIETQPVVLGEAVVERAVEGPVVISNPGTGPLEVTSIASNSDQFEFLSPGLPMSVVAGSSREVLMRYTPSALGAEVGTLTIRSNATDQPELSVAIQGSGTNGQTPRIGLETETMAFLNVPTDQARTGAFTIENRSLVDLDIEWEFGGADEFSALADAAAFTVEGGDDAFVEVTFAPQAAGEFQGALTIRSNDPDRAEIIVPVIGEAFEAPPRLPAPVFSAASIVSAAAFSGDRFAAEMWVALFGEDLADELVIAVGGLPTSLGGTSVTVTDSQGTQRAAKLQFVAPSQINFLIPAGTAAGLATVEVTNSDGETAVATVQIETVAPGLFSANASGQGPAAATFLRVAGDGTRTEGFTFSTNAPEGGRTNIPIDLGLEGDQVFLSFFGTGFRFQSAVSAQVGGLDVPVVGAVAQGQFDGLDQAVVGPLPRDLAGRDEVTVEFFFDGVAANPVTIAVR
jgi:uncharacterized protein (TIGR03437 family)